MPPAEPRRVRWHAAESEVVCDGQTWRLARTSRVEVAQRDEGGELTPQQLVWETLRARRKGVRRRQRRRGAAIRCVDVTRLGLRQRVQRRLAVHQDVHF